jgi:(p)ppGpp synthase/HD superfamily hydrolase
MHDQYGIAGRDFALTAHRENHQLYDGYLPYEFHLRLAVKTATEFVGVLVPHAYELEDILSAVWCHDVLEDTFRTYNDLKEGVNTNVADIVYAVTNEKGKTRKERANAKYYEGIKATEYAVFVKLCDRIANVTYGRYIAFNDKLYQMYQRENDKFLQALAGKQLDQLTPMVAHLRHLLRDR